MIGLDDWQRLANVPSFGRLLMSAPLGPGDLPECDRAPLRDVETLVTWMDDHSADLCMASVSIAAIESGIARLRRQASRRGTGDLTAWLETLLHLYEERILPFDVRAARMAGALSDLAHSQGQAPGFVDVAIAATAKCFGFTIVTTNVRRFEPLGIPFLDPFAGLPPPVSRRHAVCRAVRTGGSVGPPPAGARCGTAPGGAGRR